MNKLRQAIQSTIYGILNEPIYEQAKNMARAEGYSFQETVNDRAEEIERGLVVNAILNAVIEALPEKEHHHATANYEQGLNDGYNTALRLVKSILESAKEDK